MIHSPRTLFGQSVFFILTELSVNCPTIVLGCPGLGGVVEVSDIIDNRCVVSLYGSHTPNQNAALLTHMSQNMMGRYVVLSKYPTGF